MDSGKSAIWLTKKVRFGLPPKCQKHIKLHINTRRATYCRHGLHLLVKVRITVTLSQFITVTGALYTIQQAYTVWRLTLIWQNYTGNSNAISKWQKYNSNWPINIVEKQEYVEGELDPSLFLGSVQFTCIHDGRRIVQEAKPRDHRPINEPDKMQWHIIRHHQIYWHSWYFTNANFITGLYV